LECLYRVYNIALSSKLQQDHLSALQLDYLRKPSFQYDVDGLAILPPSDFKSFEENLTKLGIPIDVFSEDVYQYLLENSEDIAADERNADGQNEAFDIRRYHRYDNILNYLRQLPEQYNTTNSSIELVQFGVTHENRPLVYLKINNNSSAESVNTEKPIIVVEAAINPREWITIPAVLNVVEGILEEERFLIGADWIVLPVVNPDGYEYTHTNLRLWQKSRSTNSNLGHICPGVNINRNFDVDWQNFDASSSPCSHVYAGIEPFSEVETRMIQSIIQENGSKIKLYISLQNNGGFISYPWSFERAASGLFRQHHLLGFDMIASTNETYRLDVASTIFDRASGTSNDHARKSNIFYTFNIDIVQRGSSVLIPESDISVIVDDVWKAVSVAANEVIGLFN
ncbi:unnamed protein product, partial [Arctia plantaginis]